MSMETRMSLLNVSQEYSFCACAVMGKITLFWRNTVFVVARIPNLLGFTCMYSMDLLKNNLAETHIHFEKKNETKQMKNAETINNFSSQKYCIYICDGVLRLSINGDLLYTSTKHYQTSHQISASSTATSSSHSVKKFFTVEKKK